MRTTTLKQYLGFACALSLTISPLLASDSAQTAAYKTALSSVSALELPAKAAFFVSEAKQGQAAATVEIVKAALAANPNSAMAVVGAISKAAPAMAALAAETAASLQPKFIGAIAKAAAKAAPAQSEQIIAALTAQQPKQYSLIMAAVSQTRSDSEARFNQSGRIAVPASAVASVPTTAPASAFKLISTPGNISDPDAFSVNIGTGTPFTPTNGAPRTEISATNTTQVTTEEEANKYSDP